MKNSEVTFLKIKWFPNEGNERLLNELCYGLEEEGIIYEIEEAKTDTEKQSDSAVAYYCAVSSKFGIGVYISHKGNIIVHYKKLEIDDPYLDIKPCSDEEIREIGGNIGRLLKGQPLRV